MRAFVQAFQPLRRVAPMVKTAAAVPEEQQFILSSLSPGPAQRRLALAVVLALLVAYFITVGPLSTILLGRIDAFVPAYATAMFVIDSITSSLVRIVLAPRSTPRSPRSCCSPSSTSCVRVPSSRSQVDISSQRSWSSRGS